MGSADAIPSHPPRVRPSAEAVTLPVPIAPAPRSREDTITTELLLETVRGHRRGDLQPEDAALAFFEILASSHGRNRDEILKRIRRIYSGYVETRGLPDEAVAFAWDCLASNRGELPEAVQCRRQSGWVTRDTSVLLTYAALYLSAAFSGKAFNLARRTFSALLEEKLRVRIDGKQHVEGFIARAKASGFLKEAVDDLLRPHPIRRRDGTFPARRFEISAPFADWLERPSVRFRVSAFVDRLHVRILRQEEENRIALEDVERLLSGFLRRG